MHMKGSEDASPPRQKGNWWLPGAGGRRTTAYWAQCPLGGQHHVLKPDRDAACATLGMLSKWSFKRLNFVFNFVKLIVTSIKKIYIYGKTWLSGKESACQCRRCKRRRFDPWVGKIPQRRKWQSTPVFLPGESHGQRSLVGHSPWGR